MSMNTLFLGTAALWAASDLSGVYAVEGIREMVSAFHLKPDQTFEFHLTYGAADYWAKGTWKADGDSIVFSTPGSPVPPFRLIESKKTAGSADAIRIRVQGANGKGVSNIRVHAIGANGEPFASAQTDSSGVAHFDPRKPFAACVFEIQVYQFESEPFALKKGDDDFTFLLKGEEIMQVRFTNERVRLTETGFELRHFNPDRPMHYRLRAERLP
jgi:hypothetical protein